ncbi:MAG: PDZ domain-containing protein [Gemmatimonadetes bacterium]|nr:PDZ domain-containing protein [Gemmatimonadota bacterium]
MQIRKLLGRSAARWMVAVGVFGISASLAVPASIVAQEPDRERERNRDCRCVDPDGDPIEDCVCVAMPAIETAMAIAPFERRSIIGVTIDYEQGADADSEGARIMEVQSDGPADEAGFEEGDIVIRVAGRSLFEALDSSEERRLSESTSLPVQRFVRLVGALEPNEPAEFVVVRDGRERTLTVTPDESAAMSGFRFFGDDGPAVALRLGDGVEWEDGIARLRERMGDVARAPRPDVFRFEGPERRGEVRVFGGEGDGEPFGFRFRGDACMELAGGDGEASVFVFGGGNCIEGVEFVELNPELGEYFGTDEGILVARVAESSALGLRAGDVLMAVDGREVRSTDHARRILSSYEPDEEIRLRIMRQGAETEVLARRD